MADRNGFDEQPGRENVLDPMQGQAPAEEADLAFRDAAEQDGSPIDVEDVVEPTKRRGWLWWLGMSSLSLLVIVIGFAALGALLYNFGTMEAPAAEVQAQYDSLVARGEAPREVSSPGFRIPIPGCRCHAADPDIALKSPGRTPDAALVVAHRYRTISQCGHCHGGAEPRGVEGQPLEDAPAQ